jgi:hypothetical protein
VSFSRSGPDPVVNSIGKIRFGKWYLYNTSEKSDTWKKPLLNEEGHVRTDEYIRIIRYNIDLPSQEFVYYNILFTGEAKFLREHFRSFKPEYEDYATKLEFKDIQAAKDYIDKFIERLNKLLVFI